MTDKTLVYHRGEESWYRELSQICYSARAYVLMLMSLVFSLAYVYAYAYAYVLVKTSLQPQDFSNQGQVQKHLYDNEFSFTCKSNVSI